MAEQQPGMAQKLAYTRSMAQSFGDFLFALMCPMEKVTLWVGLFYLMLGSKTT